MSWTDRPDSISYCHGELGAVGSHEFVARLLHEKNIEPNADPFPRKELFGDAGKSNVCGDADGSSVVRCDTLPDAELIKRSVDLANQRPPRKAEGAYIAAVSEARAIRLDGISSQVVFVYDDPKPDDQFHAVLRGIDGLTRPIQNDLKSKIRRVFSRRLPATQNESPAE